MDQDIRTHIQQRYGSLARNAGAKPQSCCGPASGPESGAAGSCADPITADLYSVAEGGLVPEEALRASLGCGNPTALIDLQPGQAVLDLGSGGGIDVLLSARRVGPEGKAYGLDMTPEMLELARENQRRSGLANVEFLEGHIEAIPLPDAAVDVVISNCVINLSTDKRRVLREAFRVLRPGGRFAVSDVTLRRPLPEAARRSMELWTGCVAGALEESEYRQALADAGFVDIEIVPTRVFGRADAEGMAAAASCCGADTESLAAQLDGAVASSFIRARKPA
ncbi:MAG: arsenite methyltransferase [Planctomycetota bacterium]|nr:MAG: arsenite methyltransferase [Planctomycetota bacterium]